MRNNLRIGYPQCILDNLAEWLDWRQNRHTPRRQSLIDCVSKALSGRRADHEPTLVEKGGILLVRNHFATHRNLGCDALGDAANRHTARQMHKGQMRKGREYLRMLGEDTRIGLKNRLRVTPHVRANRHDALVPVLAPEFRVFLVDGCPGDVLDIRRPPQKQCLGLVCLDPHLVDHLGIRLPRMICPLGIGYPDVATCIGKQRRVDDLNKEVHLGLWTGGSTMVHMTNLGVLIQNVSN